MREKVVIRFLDGRILKGYLADPSFGAAFLTLQDRETDESRVIELNELKAVYFVRTFEGDPEYKENKAYGIRKPVGKRIFIKFRDGEGMIGFLEGDVPWEKGFFLYKSQGTSPGFLVVPADDGSNNIKTYVITASVDDVTIVP